MKDGIHPEFREVCFKDVSCDWTIITKSTAHTKDTIELNGKTYPLITVDISSQSHPFYTGKQRLIDTEGRAEKFKKKYGSLRRKKS
ncbi:MAG: type B 50S ribosomal protein L31 [Bdellovibrionales bacterium]|nr:type B 50S ribosomal protein L31 [Bdellovibrionales bacterium]